MTPSGPQEPSPTVRFEDFIPSDQADVRALILAGLIDRWGESDDSLNRDLDDIAVTYGHGRTIVLRDNSGIAATGTCIPINESTAQIVRMSVRCDCRRRGLARAMVAELLDTASQWGMTRVILETSSSWTDAVALYKSCGFTITKVSSDGTECDTWLEKRLD